MKIIEIKGVNIMSEHTENVKIETSTPQTAAPAAGAAPAKPKRPKPKSMIMLASRLLLSFDNARLAKERVRKSAGPPLSSRRKSLKP